VSLGDLSPRLPEEWLALARKLQDALTGQLSLPGMADEDPELDRLVKSLPGPASSDVDGSTSEVAKTAPDDLESVHFDRVAFEDPGSLGIFMSVMNSESDWGSTTS
jgi:hypothetical protein